MDPYKRESERQQEEKSDLMTLCVLEEHRAEELALDARKLVIDKRAHNTQHSHAQQLLDGTAAESATHTTDQHTRQHRSRTLPLCRSAPWNKDAQDLLEAGSGVFGCTLARPEPHHAT
jgi:hypothetical protein